MSENVVVEQRGGVLHLHLNRPEKKNALTIEMYAALAEALGRAEAEDESRVVLISGAGDSFTSGNDLRDFLSRPPTDASSPVHQFLVALMNSTKPIIAAVHGSAIGIGTTLLLHCDLVYAARDARFHLPFIQLGLVPEAASSLLLPKRIGYARAAEMLLMGTPFSAEEALHAGLISGVFEDADLMQQARERAERVAQSPPEALRITKSLLRQEDRAGIAERAQQEAGLFQERLRSDEARQRFQAFLSR
jgi:enoyl-CoA hydratase/carnithine racemase